MSQGSCRAEVASPLERASGEGNSEKRLACTRQASMTRTATSVTKHLYPSEDQDGAGEGGSCFVHERTWGCEANHGLQTSGSSVRQLPPTQHPNTPVGTSPPIALPLASKVPILGTYTQQVPTLPGRVALRRPGHHTRWYSLRAVRPSEQYTPMHP